ncbi:MAG TPA: hypothetical protein VFV05_16540 [Methylomirabilota bacterium]|nr:hypothetical protein [Methylomirabilota bacterium]
MSVNPWKLTAIAMALVMGGALLTGLVVANLTGSRELLQGAAETPAPGDAPTAPPAAARAVTTQRGTVSPAPTAAVVEACNREAARRVGTQDKALEIVRDAAVGAVVGAAVGAAGGAIAGGGKAAGKGAAIGGVVGAGGGTLYGLNENRKHDEQYRDAYANCMRTRGHLG